MVEESYFDDLDRKSLYLSSWMSDLFSDTYGTLVHRLVAPIDPHKFDNASSKIKEIGVRVLIVLGGFAGALFAGLYLGAAALILSAGSKIFKAVGLYFQKDGFTHIRGEAPEKELLNGEATVMTWNIRGYGGGLHYAEGGVVHWRSRIDRILDRIKEQEADIVFLQEVYDAALMEKIVEGLGKEYAHFYTHLGANIWGYGSGCMVMAKCAVAQFVHTDFEATDPHIKRGFQTIEIKAHPEDPIPCARMIGTQLSHGKRLDKIETKQVAQIINALAGEKFSMPTFFVGNVGEEPSLPGYLYHSYRGDEPTHSDELVNQWAPIFEGKEESKNWISLFRRHPIGDMRIFPVLEKGITRLNAYLVWGFSPDYNTKTALSDHHAVVAKFGGVIARQGR